MTKTRTHKTAAQRKSEAEQLHASIADQIEALTASDGWALFLRAATGFHRYSLNNLMLILAQRPDATQVAGFRQWQDRGRQVRAGEKGIRIFGFSSVRTQADEDEDDGQQRRPVFPVLTVFDVAQTDPIPGAEIAEIAPRLIGEDPTGIYDAVEAWLKSSGWTVTRELLDGEDGATSTGGSRRVRIHVGLSAAHAALTILHEAAHVLLHTSVDDYHHHRGIYETEAESVAYVVAGALGLDTSANSIGYIAAWTNGDVAIVKRTAERVLTTASAVLDAVTDLDT